VRREEEGGGRGDRSTMKMEESPLKGNHPPILL